MHFLTQCKLGILCLGVKRPCAKLRTHPMQNRSRISGAVPQWPKCFCSTGWDQFDSFVTRKILSQAVFAFLSPLIGQIPNMLYASSNQRNYSRLQIELMIKDIYLYRLPNSVLWLPVRAPLVKLVEHCSFQKANYQLFSFSFDMTSKCINVHTLTCLFCLCQGCNYITRKISDHSVGIERRSGGWLINHQCCSPPIFIRINYISI